MKLLVVLVLAVFTGCNANILFADEPRTKLVELTDAFRDYVNTVKRSAEDFLEKMGRTKFGQDLSARLEEGARVAKTNIEHIGEALGQRPREVMRHLNMQLYGLAISVQEVLPGIEDKLRPLAERLAPVTANVLSELTQKTQQVRDTVSPYVNMMMEKADSWSQDLPARLDTLYDSF